MKTINEVVEEFEKKFEWLKRSHVSGAQLRDFMMMKHWLTETLTARDAEVAKTAGVRELDILAAHINRQIIEPTVSTESLITYIQQRHDHLINNNPLNHICTGKDRLLVHDGRIINNNHD